MIAARPPGLSTSGNSGEGVVEVLELVVDRDPQGLEDAGGRVDRPPLAGDAPADDRRQAGRWS